jgi:CxxC motif-containing protein (DUF1111 family)
MLEDTTNILKGNASSPNFNTPIDTASEMSSDVMNFGAFTRLSAPPTPASPATSPPIGASTFAQIGCALCHSPSLTTGNSPYTRMSSVTYHPYSDFALHHMGSSLADNFTQAGAGPDMFPTAPLWGIGQRLFFLQHGRMSDLLRTIEAHSGPGSEVNAVTDNFNGLTSSQKQATLDFLGSL